MSDEAAKENKEQHEASGGNKSLGGDVPDPDDEEAIQVRLIFTKLYQIFLLKSIEKV